MATKLDITTAFLEQLDERPISRFALITEAESMTRLGYGLPRLLAETILPCISWVVVAEYLLRPEHTAWGSEE